MSLINDALQRAKQVQQTAPPAEPNLQLRPADTQPAASRTFGLVWFVVLGAALLGGIASAVIRVKGDRPHASHEMANAFVVQADAQAAAPVEANPSAASNLPMQSEAGPESLAAAEPPAVLVPETPPPPIAPRLQGILFNPAHPSAIIDGATVFVGSTVGNQRVATISAEAVTLIGPDQTNVLSVSSGR